MYAMLLLSLRALPLCVFASEGCDSTVTVIVVMHASIPDL